MTACTVNLDAELPIVVTAINAEELRGLRRMAELHRIPSLATPHPDVVAALELIDRLDGEESKEP